MNKNLANLFHLAVGAGLVLVIAQVVSKNNGQVADMQGLRDRAVGSVDDLEKIYAQKQSKGEDTTELESKAKAIKDEMMKVQDQDFNSQEGRDKFQRLVNELNDLKSQHGVPQMTPEETVKEIQTLRDRATSAGVDLNEIYVERKSKGLDTTELENKAKAISDELMKVKEEDFTSQEGRDKYSGFINQLEDLKKENLPAADESQQGNAGEQAAPEPLQENQQ